MPIRINCFFGFTLMLVFLSCQPPKKNEPATLSNLKAFSNARIITGIGEEVIEEGILLINDDKIVRVGQVSDTEIPEGVTVFDLKGKTIIPGLINAHAHVGDVKGIEPGHYSEENILDQLRLYARYGITTVVSLGGDAEEAVSLRHVNNSTKIIDHSRLFIAGTVVSDTTVAGAVKSVDQNVEMGVDFIKIRVDDNLGNSEKMTPEIYKAIIQRAHEHNLKLAAHLFYLDDAKALIDAGADFLAHSIRDREVDNQLIEQLRNKNICYCPTLTRDLSTFVYENTPDFFKDPFFLKEFNDSIFAPLTNPERQQRIRNSPSAHAYKAALQVANTNLILLQESGVSIAFGTDSGIPTRFQGYFEHLEMKMMQDAGMEPVAILQSATSNPSMCMGLGQVGSLQPDYYADFVVLDQNPLDDIINTRTINAVWIGGNQIDPEN